MSSDTNSNTPPPPPSNPTSSDDHLLLITIPKLKIPPPESTTWSSSFKSIYTSTTPRSRQSSPRSPALPREITTTTSSLSATPSRLSNSNLRSSTSSFGFLYREKQKGKGRRVFKGSWYKRKRVVVGFVGSVGLLFFVMNWWMLSTLQDEPVSGGVKSSEEEFFSGNSTAAKGGWRKFTKGKRSQRMVFARMLGLAAHALAEGYGKPEPKDLWEEPLIPASAWTPCADQHNSISLEGNNGYLLLSANGGINQQRVAVCNAVAVARLLNASLVVPQFLFSSVWRDLSQFSDIYQEDHFINYLKPDLRIVKELPVELQSLDLEAIGSVVTDADIMKESKPSFYLKNILPILLQNRVVHLLGFGNRLAFDPVPFELQKLRCRCNFHALRFVPKIQETGSLLLRRMRQKTFNWGSLDHYLVGPFAAEPNMKEKEHMHKRKSRYLALHLRFEIDMVAHSICDFGGGEEEREELEAYRSIHFPALTLLQKSIRLPSAAALRSEGKCPLTPEESVLMLVALGFRRETNIYLAGAHIYGGKSRLAALTSLYPNLVTKESLLSTSEIKPFMNFSSQLAALDFIGCAAADAFAMTDSGSQLSSLVTGYRIYFGGGRMPSIRPNKRRLASIFLKNSTIEWSEFEERVRKAVKESKYVHERPLARSIYRHPRCRECMCHKD